MRAQNAAAPKSGGDRRGGRGSDRRGGKRDHYLAKKVADRQASVPDTALARTFLRALKRWLDRPSTSRQIVLPTGVVSDVELARVLRAVFGGGAR